MAVGTIGDWVGAHLADTNSNAAQTTLTQEGTQIDKAKRDSGYRVGTSTRPAGAGTLPSLSDAEGSALAACRPPSWFVLASDAAAAIFAAAPGAPMMRAAMASK